MPDAPFISANNLFHTFDDSLEVLVDISLTIEAGEFVVLVGPSGVGKSTLLRLLGGLITPTQGTVQIEGVAATEIVQPVGLVFQNDNLMPWRTAAENVRLPLEITENRRKSTNGRVQEMLDLVGLAGFENSFPAQLSGGMAQRVALARALVHQPALLLLDEPFGALDALTRERMGQELLRIWQAVPVTVFMVTHSITEAVLLADKVLVMGAVSPVGRPATITHQIPIDILRPRQLDVQETVVFYAYARTIRDAIKDPKQ